MSVANKPKDSSVKQPDRNGSRPVMPPMPFQDTLHPGSARDPFVVAPSKPYPYVDR